MQIETSFVAIAFTSVIGLQGWILKEVVSLKVNVATLTTEHNIMKKRINTILALAILAPLLCLFSGCSSTGGVGGALGNVLAAPGKLLDKAADTISSVTTNVVTSTGNSGETILTTNRVAVLSPIVAKSENVAKTLVDYLPAPYAQAAELALGGATALLGIFVRRKQRRIDEHADTIADLSNEAMSATSQLEATITGVEKAVKAGTPVKEEIAKAAALNGVGPELARKVQEIAPNVV